MPLVVAYYCFGYISLGGGELRSVTQHTIGAASLHRYYKLIYIHIYRNFSSLFLHCFRTGCESSIQFYTYD